MSNSNPWEVCTLCISVGVLQHDHPVIWLCSFAGGKNDPSDKDVVDTALREAREELGVTVATEKVWGILKPLRETVSK